MMTQEKLIERYEKQLEKVIEHFKGDCRYESYIEFAKSELEEVKNGRTW